MKSNEEISLEQAFGIARKQALDHLGVAVNNECLDVLQGISMEAKHCWMFFTNLAIDVDHSVHLGIRWAYAVSKHGYFSLVQDFSDDPKRLGAYLLQMSDYFERKGL